MILAPIAIPEPAPQPPPAPELMPVVQPAPSQPPFKPDLDRLSSSLTSATSACTANLPALTAAHSKCTLAHPTSASAQFAAEHIAQCATHATAACNALTSLAALVHGMPECTTHACADERCAWVRVAVQPAVRDAQAAGAYAAEAAAGDGEAPYAEGCGGSTELVPAARAIQDAMLAVTHGALLDDAGTQPLPPPPPAAI